MRRRHRLCARRLRHDARHFSLDAPETLHDAWLMELAVREPAAGER